MADTADADARARANDEVQALLADDSQELREVQALPDPLGTLRRRDLAQDIGLKRIYGRYLLLGLGAQVVVADVIFGLYAWKGVHWDVDATVMQTWLAATVVEVVGVVLVITRYLFPRRDRGVVE